MPIAFLILPHLILLTCPPPFQQMSTKEKLIGHVMKDEPVGSRNKVTVVGVGMVGMAAAISVLLKVRQMQRNSWVVIFYIDKEQLFATLYKN